MSSNHHNRAAREGVRIRYGRSQMRRKHLLSLFMLSMGVALLIAATAAGVATSATRHVSSSDKARAGGTLKVALFGDFDYLDPQIAYNTGDWTALEATDVTLVRYPDQNVQNTPLQLEGAASWPVISKNGKVYTWRIKSGFAFNDGTKVTAASYKRAFERLLSPCMYGGGVGVADFFQTTIVGGAKFNSAKCTNGKSSVPNLSGVIAKGNKLIIKLTKPTAYMTEAMAMIWFSAMKANTPYDNQNQGDTGATVTYPSAGPYYIAARDAAQGTTVLKLNPHYHGKRAHNPSEIDFISYGSQATAEQDTKSGSINVDLAGLPAADVDNIASTYGAHTDTGVAGASKGKAGQFHVEKTDCVDYIEFNTQKAPTNNVNVRKALEYALDRYQILHILGPFAGSLTDQVLTPAIPGYKKFGVYPNDPNPEQAIAIGGSALKNAGTFQVWHTTSGTRTNQAQVIENDINLLKTNFNANVSTNDTPLDATSYYDQLGNKSYATGPNGYNIARAGWCADYYDPFDYLNVLFNGQGIGPVANNDSSYLNAPALNKQLDKAALKTGKARVKAYAALDKEIQTKYAPVLAYELIGVRIFLSAHTGNYTYDGFQGDPSLNALTVTG